MRCKLAIIVVVVFSITSFGAEKDEGISNTKPNQRIPGHRYSSIREVDFRNSPIMPLDADNKSDVWPPLKHGAFYRKGSWEKGNSYSGDEIDLESVRYIAAPAGREWALIRLRWTTIGGSSSSEGQVLVIDLDSDGYPVIRQKIEYNIRGADPDEAWAHFNPADNRLRVSAVHGWEHCCNKRRIIITFDWKGEKFVPVGRKVLPLRHPQ